MSIQNGKGSKRRPRQVSREQLEQNWDRIFPKTTMKLYRVKDNATGLYYRHRYSQFRGGDWVAEQNATIWTKPGGAAGALGAIREKAVGLRKSCTFMIETAAIDPKLLEWK